MQQLRIITLACLAMIAFAGNSLLCRIALKQTSIDPASFTTIRLLSGAVILFLIVSLTQQKAATTKQIAGSWLSASALFVYMVTFSFAFTTTTASVGSLILFGAVQTTMIVYAIIKGQRLSKIQGLGLVLAYIGLITLFLPDISNNQRTDANILGPLLMLVSGIAWGIYSLMGQNTRSPILVTKNNFVRATLFALIISMLMLSQARLGINGVVLAIASGAVTSGIGYAIWYSVLHHLKISTAAVIQLSVPVIAAVGGFLILDESITLYFILSSGLILGGTALVILNQQ